MHQERAPTRPQRRPPGNVFRLEGEYWTIAYGDALYRLRNTAGLRCLAYLLRRPGDKVAATELARIACTPNGRRGGPEQRRTTRPEHARRGRPARLGMARHAELARVKTTRSIRAAMQRIGAHDASLITHLRATIKTGVLCSYSPDPRLPVEWTF